MDLNTEEQARKNKKETNESVLESMFVRRIKALGGRAYKFTSPGQRGVPDRIVAFPRGELCFVELKRKSGKLTKLQKTEQRKLIELGFAVFTLHGKEEIEDFIKSIRDAGEASEVQSAS